VGIHYFDATLRNEIDAARLLGCPILAGIPHTDVEVVPAGATPAPGPNTGPAPSA
jgi:hypothetical protein